MKQIIPLKIDVSLDRQSPIRTGAIIYSQDKNSAYFKIELNAEMEEVIVLFKGDDFDVQVEAVNQDGNRWLAQFDHTLISQYDDIEAFVYGKNGDKNYDIGVARFSVSVSEIDKTIPRIKVVYFEKLEDVADEFRGWIEDYKLSADADFVGYAEYMDELKQKVDDGEFTGEQGEQGTQGIQGVKGDGFSIAKTFNSVESMDGTGLEENDFVLIDTGDVEDEDNAKLFLWTGSEFHYLTDLSGAQGIKGEQGEQGVQGEQGIQGIQGIQGEQGETGTRAFAEYGTEIPTELADGEIFVLVGE